MSTQSYLKSKLAQCAKNEKILAGKQSHGDNLHTEIKHRDFKKGRAAVTHFSGSNKQKATGPTSRVEIFVSAKNLADLDTFTLSDPLCTLKVKNSKHGGYIDYGSTEVIDNNLNPKWVKNFQVEYYFDK